MGDNGEPPDQPQWWQENQRLREEMGLPRYKPARLDDGEYLHNSVSTLENQYDCQIELFAINPQHPDSWQIRVNGNKVLEIKRTKTVKGNTIYKMTSEEFEARLKNHLKRHK